MQVSDPYAEFSQSPDGQIQHRLILGALAPHLASLPTESRILDAGCGDGWLTAKLSEKFSDVSGSDISPELIKVARENHPTLEFTVQDLSNPFPESAGNFDAIIMNMVFHNIQNQTAAAKHLHAALKKDGQLLAVLPNPYYTFPVARWQRTWLEKLFGHKPSLRLRPYGNFLNKTREFLWSAKPGGEKISGRFSPLPEQINTLITAGFRLEKIEEIISPAEPLEFNLDYRAARFPIFLLLVLKKLA